MGSKKIPLEVQNEVNLRIEHFNQKAFGKNISKFSYIPEYKGKYLYLNRLEYGNVSPVARLTYKGEIDNWDFAIFRWSTERYDPDEWFFPGVKEVDGTVEGAMKAGIKAYPL